MSDRVCLCGCGDRLYGMRPDALYRSEACKKRHERARSRDKAGTGVGSRGGNVRSVEEARDLQATVKAKRDWAGAIDEQIRSTLVSTSHFHADDLDVLEVPPEHCNLKGTRAAWFRNKGWMASTDVYRKVSHAAANGRKAPIYRITEKGRQELSKLVGVDAGVSLPKGAAASPDGVVRSPSVDPGERSSGAGVPPPQGVGGPGLPAPYCASTGAPDPEPLSLLPEPPRYQDADQSRAA